MMGSSILGREIFLVVLVLVIIGFMYFVLIVVRFLYFVLAKEASTTFGAVLGVRVSRSCLCVFIRRGRKARLCWIMWGSRRSRQRMCGCLPLRVVRRTMDIVILLRRGVILRQPAFRDRRRWRGRACWLNRCGRTAVHAFDSPNVGKVTNV